MRSSLLLVLTFCAILPATTQRGSAADTNVRSQYRFPPDHMACPVVIRADRRANIISREVDGKVIPTGQGLALHFVNPPDRKPIEADITVHGYSGRVIAQPLTVNSSAELIETFHLTGSASEPLVQKTVWTARIHGIVWLELTRVLFSDGSSWQSTIPSECRIEPSLFVLVK